MCNHDNDTRVNPWHRVNNFFFLENSEKKWNGYCRPLIGRRSFFLFENDSDSRLRPRADYVFRNFGHSASLSASVHSNFASFSLKKKEEKNENDFARFNMVVKYRQWPVIISCGRQVLQPNDRPPLPPSWNQCLLQTRRNELERRKLSISDDLNHGILVSFQRKSCAQWTLIMLRQSTLSHSFPFFSPKYLFAFPN